MVSKAGKRVTYANVTATLALVFAMTGGAYAASKYLITSSKQISPKVLKQLASKAGPKGATGAAGLAGPAGPGGAAGPKGESGAPGQEGKEGKPGVPGEPGTEGKEGSPWIVGGVLPAGKTETGVWGLAALPGAFQGGFIELASTSISFTIPLKAPLAEANMHIIPPSGKGAGGKTCPTSSSVLKPAAEPGNLCIFEREGSNVGEISVFSPGIEGEGIGTTGVIVNVKPETKGESIDVSGTWAVTESE